MLRPIPIRNYLRIADVSGFAGKDILADTRISLDAIDDPGYLVDFDEYRQVLENMARFGDNRGAGLDAGLGTSIPDLGALGYAALYCRTARHSMEEFWPRYGETFGLFGKPVFSADNPRNPTINIVTPALSPSAQRFCVEETLSLLLHLGGTVARQRPAIECIELAYAAPVYHERYRELFRCPVHFNARQTRVAIQRKWLEKPLLTKNEALSGFYQQHLGKFRQHIESCSPLASRVRNLLLHCHEGTLPSVAEAARMLGLAERTLSRYLQKNGISYRKLTEEFRIGQALTLMESASVQASSKTSAKTISRQIGFRDINAFRRAFKKWTGQTVNQYRKAN